ncbi:NAD(P)-binding protein [Pyrenochaeta sp. DS3sAY3a]|nr:NAD(P)-binding protein [Pyrenochaeta sp. DS3sAY3a]
MAQLTILGDKVIKNLLLDLSQDQLLYFQKELEDCLITYSTETERQYQPNSGIINRPNGQKILFRPFTSPESVGTKIVASSTVQQPALHGVVVICDRSGIPTGLLNAEEVTGYRTSFSAMIPVTWRRRVENVVVFGAGKQALWHTRLVLALRASDVGSITIINRTEARACELIEMVQQENQERWKSKCTFDNIASQNDEAQEQIQKLLRTADVVFCTVPSREPLFSLQALDLESRQGNYPLITAVGSWQADMVEVEPEILKHVASGPMGVVLVDDSDSALAHSGEIIRSGLKKEQLLEIGNILQQKHNQTLKADFSRELEEGLVAYKSIGVSVTDLAAGNVLLALAAEKGVGSLVQDF